jgi:hypothetical protein
MQRRCFLPSHAMPLNPVQPPPGTMSPVSVINCDLCCAYLFSFGFFLQDISTNTNLLKGPPYPSSPGGNVSKGQLY